MINPVRVNRLIASSSALRRLPPSLASISFNSMDIEVQKITHGVIFLPAFAYMFTHVVYYTINRRDKVDIVVHWRQPWRIVYKVSVRSNKTDKSLMKVICVKIKNCLERVLFQLGSAVAIGSWYPQKLLILSLKYKFCTVLHMVDSKCVLFDQTGNIWKLHVKFLPQSYSVRLW